MSQSVKKFLKLFLYFHLIVAAGLLLTHCSFSHYAKVSYSKAKKEKPFDVIIVPGIPYEKESTTSIMAMRVFWAKHLYDSGYARNIIFSGSAVYSPYVEGIAMKIIADSLGIPTDHTFSETRAEHSTENIYYSWKMAKAMGYKKIALATDPFQSGMLRSFIKRYCPGVKSVPVVYDILELDSKNLPEINLTTAYVDDFVSITKREGFWQRLRGTMGQRVKEEVKSEGRRMKEEARTREVSSSN
ncbi:MAG: YdcF family protein [Chryseolinea sp.]